MSAPTRSDDAQRCRPFEAPHQLPEESAQMVRAQYFEPPAPSRWIRRCRWAVAHLILLGYEVALFALPTLLIPSLALYGLWHIVRSPIMRDVFAFTVGLALLVWTERRWYARAHAWIQLFHECKEWP